MRETQVLEKDYFKYYLCAHVAALPNTAQACHSLDVSTGADSSKILERGVDGRKKFFGYADKKLVNCITKILDASYKSIVLGNWRVISLI